MSEQPSTSPATEAGTTRPAGEGIDDQEMSHEVAEATSSDLKAEQVFENEKDGTYTDASAQQASADDLGG